jgi:hypothetical protein
MEVLPSLVLGLPPIFNVGQCVHFSFCLNTYSCCSFNGVFFFFFVVEQLGIGRLRQYAFDSFCLGTSNNLGTKHFFSSVCIYGDFIFKLGFASLFLLVFALVVPLLFQLG